jgi:hypothetical protein
MGNSAIRVIRMTIDNIELQVGNANRLRLLVIDGDVLRIIHLYLLSHYRVDVDRLATVD